MTYQDPSDLKRTAELASLAPTEAQAWLKFDHSIERQDGQIPRRYRELIAVAAALTAQCAYCIDRHTRAAQALGISRAEIAEATMIAAAIRSGATLGHGLLALKVYDAAERPEPR
jgi:AhpD family alkylhydroperoxidase